MEMSGKGLRSVLEGTFATTSSACGELLGEGTKSGSRGSNFLSSGTKTSGVSTDGLRSEVIWYASQSSYRALKLCSYCMVKQKQEIHLND